MKKLIIFFSLLAIILNIIGIFCIRKLYTTHKSMQTSLESMHRESEALQSRIQKLRHKIKELSLISHYYEIEHKVEQIRGLYALSPLQFNIITRDKLRNIVLAKMEEEYPPEEFSKMERAAKIIGLIDYSVDLKKTLLNVYEEQIAAFYDFDTKELYTVESNFMSKSISDMFLAHEIVHALQDQHFDLIKMGLTNDSNIDRQTAISSLIEGDATYTMSLYYSQNMSLRAIFDVFSGLLMMYKQEKIDQAPLYIRESLLFPYMQGLEFVAKWYDNDSPISIDDVFAFPPATTEHIIHPERYYPDYDEPVYPLLPDMDVFFTENNLIPLFCNTLGELNMKIIFQNMLPREKAVTAAQGWDGDAFVVFEDSYNPEINGFIIQSHWDSPQDAIEFCFTYLQMIKLKYPAMEHHELQETGTNIIKLADNRSLFLSISSDKVTIALTTPKLLDNLLDVIALN
ncbi:MAG: hypothetical protein C4541_02245 [Candidatus Auribacter fodinae]|jgi:hypothetical protein|uniref:Uncharacterized protein n=1 Tax=Candidatus Auribacter fodinae TaxID=2093366 RepID=A0A3A4R589_9BACT|nr:MAG: hypothetical protein C4541_02245 [Candidatus Auribacter fodinae]